MVIVHVGGNNRHDVGEVLERVGITAGIDDQFLARIFEHKASVAVLSDLHAFRLVAGTALR